MRPSRPERRQGRILRHPLRRIRAEAASILSQLDEDGSASVPESEREGESGSAVVEFVFLGVLLLVPIVYLVLTVGQVQGGSFAVVGAADQASKVFVDGRTPQEADARARAAALLALEDFGFEEGQASVDIACDEECLTPGSTVTVVVRLSVPLPLVPSIGGSRTSVATVDAEATQIVERFG